MKIILTGATGFLGKEVLKQLLADAKVNKVIVLVRKPTNIKHPKLTEYVLKDFLDYADIINEVKADSCIWCLGVPQSAVTKDEYIKITYDYAMYAASQMLAANPQFRFCFVSGVSANQEEKGISLQGRIKGRTEKALALLGGNIYLFRPAFIKPADSSYKRPPIQTFAKYITNILDLFSEAFSIDVVTLAICLIGVAKKGSKNNLMSNIAIKQYQENFY
jgi:uncharacterized protein YbjT (DUF2867 family)